MRVAENTQWVQQQFESCELGDKRRTKRVCRMAMNMLECPDKSLPTQSDTWSDLKAAYRWCQVTFDAVATPHWEQTRATKPGRYKVLKTGCQIERHALRETSRLEPLTALISVIGVRLLQLKTIGRHDP